MAETAPVTVNGNINVTIHDEIERKRVADLENRVSRLAARVAELEQNRYRAPEPVLFRDACGLTLEAIIPGDGRNQYVLPFRYTQYNLRPLTREEAMQFGPLQYYRTFQWEGRMDSWGKRIFQEQV